MSDPFAEIGRSGLAVWAGRPHADPLRELRGPGQYRAFNEMRLNDPVIAATLFAVEQSIRALPWSVEPKGDARAGFVDECLKDMSHTWNDHLSEALTMLPFGWAWFEIVYKRRPDGRIGWRKFAIRGQNTLHRWDLDEQGGVRGLVQLCPPKYEPVTVPIEKSILYRTRIEQGNPEGRSILRAAYTSYYFARNLRGMKDAVGSDIRFCFFARAAGFTVWGDPDARSGHYISYPLSPGDFVESQALTAHIDEQIAAMRAEWRSQLALRPERDREPGETSRERRVSSQ